MHSHYGRLNDCTTLAHSFSLDLRLHLRRLHDERRESCGESPPWSPLAARRRSPGSEYPRPRLAGTHVHLLHRLLDDAVGKANLVEDPCMDHALLRTTADHHPDGDRSGSHRCLHSISGIKEAGITAVCKIFQHFRSFYIYSPWPTISAALSAWEGLPEIE